MARPFPPRWATLFAWFPTWKVHRCRLIWALHSLPERLLRDWICRHVLGLEWASPTTSKHHCPHHCPQQRKAASRGGLLHFCGFENLQASTLLLSVVCGGKRRGKVTENVAPEVLEASLLASIEPPCFSTIHLLTHKPSPVPRSPFVVNSG